MARHLLYGSQVDAEIEQVPDPGPAQVMRSGGLDLGLKPALTTDPPCAAGAEASQLIPLPKQAPGLEHRTEERARLGAASLQPILDRGEDRGGQGDLARFAALAPAHTELAADQVEIAEIDGDRLRATETAAVGYGQEGGVTPAAQGRVLTTS
jgi:hypothetical protein